MIRFHIDLRREWTQFVQHLDARSASRLDGIELLSLGVAADSPFLDRSLAILPRPLRRGGWQKS